MPAVVETAAAGEVLPARGGQLSEAKLLQQAGVPHNLALQLQLVSVGVFQAADCLWAQVVIHLAQTWAAMARRHVVQLLDKLRKLHALALLQSAAVILSHCGDLHVLQVPRPDRPLTTASLPDVLRRVVLVPAVANDLVEVHGQDAAVWVTGEEPGRVVAGVCASGLAEHVHLVDDLLCTGGLLVGVHREQKAAPHPVAVLLRHAEAVVAVARRHVEVMRPRLAILLHNGRHAAQEQVAADLGEVFIGSDNSRHGTNAFRADQQREQER
mmetsp:Transcript_203/g.528  ORF Transcript_203/g.528 Transcript_203/m.528 type:complete len:269 (+) Transcript_203:200-1006(+)